MSIVVYGTWCNPTPHFGLSFYCQGSSSACDVFRNFPTVSCVSQPNHLYCTNHRACGGANITNDVYIEFPSHGPLTALDYDTITRATYQFNRTISIAAYTKSNAAGLDTLSPDEAVETSRSTPSLSQTVLSTFENSYSRNINNPTRLLVNSLASTLFSLHVKGGAASVAALQNKIRDALFAATSSSTTATIAAIRQCKELDATADSMSSVNHQFITNVTRQIILPSRATWLLTNFVGHIIANSAAAEEVDVIKEIEFSSLATTCGRPSTTTSKPNTSSKRSTTSKHSTTSSKSTTSPKRSTTSPNRSTTSTSSPSSQATKSSSTSTSSTSQPVQVSSFTTNACPSATPTGALVYQSNSTQNQALNGSFAMYNGSLARLQNVLLAPINASSALYSFPNSNTIALTLPDGEALIYTANVAAITYIEAGCSTALKFTGSDPSTNLSTRSEIASKRTSSGLSVVMSVTDQCGNPVTSGYTLALDCAEVLYPQTNAASGPVVEPPTPEIFANTGGGTYTAVCDLSGLDSANTAYNTCATEDATSLNNFCGQQLSTVHDTKDYIEGWIKDAKEFASLVKYAKIAGEILEKTNPALDFWDRMCDKQWGLENPLVQQQFDAEDCGYPAALSMALEGTDAGGSPSTAPLGTFAATPTTIYLSTTTSLASAACCAASPTATPDYVSVSDNCTSHSAGLGKSVFCCSGACLDGTRIGEAGQCQYWLDLCGDVEGGAPSCGATQVLSYGDPPTVDSGDGCCGACCCECQYQRNNWSYNCCDCPEGYQAVDQGACDGPSSQCVGCSDPNLTLVQASNGTYSCVCKD